MESEHVVGWVKVKGGGKVEFAARTNRDDDVITSRTNHQSVPTIEEARA